jgi:hypothetical protein
VGNIESESTSGGVYDVEFNTGGLGTGYLAYDANLQIKDKWQILWEGSVGTGQADTNASNSYFWQIGNTTQAYELRMAYFNDNGIDKTKVYFNNDVYVIDDINTHVIQLQSNLDEWGQYIDASLIVDGNHVANTSNLVGFIGATGPGSVQWGQTSAWSNWDVQINKVYYESGLALTNPFDNRPVAISPDPSKPYIGWYRPGQAFINDPSLYTNMNLELSGGMDALALTNAGKVALRWVSGLQNSYAASPDYWYDRADPRIEGDVIQTGIIVDEWTNPYYDGTHPLGSSAEMAMEGLRRARAEWSDMFIAVWATEVDADLAALVLDGTVDLVILDGYTHQPASWGGCPCSTDWAGVLAKAETAVTFGVADKTIMGFGDVTDEASGFDSNDYLTEAELEFMVSEIARLYPQFPGVAFYQAHDRTNAAALDIISIADALSGTYYPSAIEGDLDGDGFVGITDLNIVLGNWNQNVTPGNLIEGDPNGDGFVGIEDLNEVLGNWNAGTPPNDGSAVPEPASLSLLGIGTASMLRRMKR